MSKLPTTNRPLVTPAPDWLDALSHRSGARLALGRAGIAMPTAAQLAFGLDHARARDAVHSELDTAGIATGLAALGHAPRTVQSQVVERRDYLRRPDLGRRLSNADRLTLEQHPRGTGLVIVVADGLSAQAANGSAIALIKLLLPRLPQPLAFVVARQCRVAAGDDICLALGATAVLMLIGERPGLSSANSLGAYLTFAPTQATSDAQRNCVSNIRPDGLPLPDAAHRIAWLITEAFRTQTSGVTLKDLSASAAPLERP